MKLFLSWSGEKSHKVALIFKEWIPSVIQLVKELETSTFGIIFVTTENLEAPWIHF